MFLSKFKKWLLPSLWLLVATLVDGRSTRGRTDTDESTQKQQQRQLKHDPRAQTLYHYGDYSAERKMYTVEFSSEPLLVKYPDEYRDRQRHRHVLEYQRYLESQQADLVADLIAEDAEVVISFQFVFNGVTLMMTDAQADQMRQRSDVLRVWEESIDDLLDERTTMTTTTDDSPQRMLAPLTHRGKLWANDQGLTGEDIVIGVLDTGIVPENPSFDDGPGQGNNPQSYGAAPTHFTGTGCAFGNTDWNDDDASFTCQGKILAAKCYAKTVSLKYGNQHLCGGDGARLEPGHFLSARDDDGHGTHVASTAAGNAGVPATVDGKVVGFVQGVAPRARISVYKVCWDGSCGTIDSLSALEDAVKDNVDVINYSIGGTASRPTDVAFLNLLQAGIVPVAAAGNDGPDPSTVSFPAAYPWMVAVAASGDPLGTALVFQISAPAAMQGIYEASTAKGGVVKITTDNLDLFASEVVAVEPHIGCTALDQNLDGKVALVIRGDCTFEQKINAAHDAGAQAVLIYNDGTAPDRMGLVNMQITGRTDIPAVFLTHATGAMIKENLDTGVSPTIGLEFASNEKTVAAFSSRGPNTRFSTDLIKPDIVAPGMDVLAADAPLVVGASGRQDDFGFMDGTSMASPHIAGFMALMKQGHPGWSPSALKSAMMTTARQDIRKSLFDFDTATPLEVGSGFPVINRALEPGLVYDITMDEHRAAYCGFDDEGVGQKECKELEKEGFSLELVDLNYPSISISNAVGTRKVIRTVTNVASDAVALQFKAELEASEQFHVTVEPCEFVLAYGESLTFEVTLEPVGLIISSDWLFGSLTWVGYELEQVPAVRPQESATMCSTDDEEMAQAPNANDQVLISEGEFLNRKRYLRTRRGVPQEEALFVQDSIQQDNTTSPIPTMSPSDLPTPTPTDTPTQLPTDTPTVSPTSPTSSPTDTPTSIPTESPTSPTSFPTDTPTQSPSVSPSLSPSNTPTITPASDNITTSNTDRMYSVYSPIAIKFDLLGQLTDGNMLP